MKLTIDANLFVSLYIEEDAFHQSALMFFELCERWEVHFFAPVILLSEVSGTVSRIRRHARYGEIALRRILSLTHVRFRQLDFDFAETAALLASCYALRGADATYLALANETKTALITLDEELIDRSPSSISAMSPLAWCERNLPT